MGKSFHNKIVKAIVVSMALSGLLMGCSSTDPVATVGDAKITEEELTDSLVMQYGAEVLDILISNKIVELEAEKAKISVTDGEIEEEYKTYIDYYGNEETLTKTLESYGMSADKFRDELQSSILTEKVLASTIKITDNELEMFFEENKANYATVEQVEASHIAVEDEATANKVVEHLNAGEEFAELAAQYSTDSSSSENGGELGRFGRGAMEREFEDVAFGLEVGEISKPVKTEEGFHIIKVTDKVEAKEAVYDDFKEKVYEELMNQKMTEEYPAWLEEKKEEYQIVNYLQSKRTEKSSG